MAKIRQIARYTSNKFRSGRTRRLLPGGMGQGRHRGPPRLAVRRGRRRGASGPTSSSSPTARSMPKASRSRRFWRCRRSISTWSTRACAPAPAWWSRPAPRVKFTTSRCWLATAPRRSTPTWRMETLQQLCRRRRDRREIRQALRQGVGKGLMKVVSKMGISLTCPTPGADLRGSGSQRRRWSTSTSPAPPAGRRHRRPSRWPKKPSACTEGLQPDPVLANMLDAGANTPSHPRRRAYMWTPDAIAKLQHSNARQQGFETAKEYAQIINDQSKRHMTLRGLFSSSRRARRAGRGRAGQGDRQALCHRCDVARLDLDRGARHRPSP